jgi:steroid delta-isomerase-like uncharacterized protein
MEVIIMESRNVELLRSSLEALNANDLDTCLERIEPDFIINIAGAPQMHGREQWKQNVAIFRAAFPDMQAKLEDIFGSGDRVAMRLTFTGTHAGEFQGIPATGRTVTYSSNELYRVNENGLIAEEWICSDTASLFAQIS